MSANIKSKRLQLKIQTKKNRKLCARAEKGDCERVQALLEDGADVDSRDKNG